MLRLLAPAVLLLVACNGTKDEGTATGTATGTGTGTGTGDTDTGAGTGTGTGTGDPGPNTWTDGSSERCLLLFGDNDRVIGGDLFLPFGTAARTLQAWVRTINKGDQIATSYGRNAVGASYAIGTLNGKPYLTFGGSERVYGDIDIADDAWHHVVAAWDGTTVVLMVDGATETVQMLGGDTLPGNTMAGNMPEGGSLHLPFYGWVDDVKLFDIARQPDDVARDLDGEDDSGQLSLWWDFEVDGDPSGANVQIEDLSDNDNHGTSAGLKDHPTFPWCR